MTVTARLAYTYPGHVLVPLRTVQVTLRRPITEDNFRTPAYTRVNGKTVSGWVAVDKPFYNYGYTHTFFASGKNTDLLYPGPSKPIAQAV